MTEYHSTVWLNERGSIKMIVILRNCLKTIIATLAIGSFGYFHLAAAGPIGAGDFTASAHVDDFESGIGPHGVYNYSIIRDDFRLNSNVSSFIYSSWGGTSILAPNTAPGIADIVFNTPWQKAGVYVSLSYFQVQFFDGDGDFLDAWLVYPNGFSFVGYDAGSAGIGMIRIVDAEILAPYVWFDRVTYEGPISPNPVPSPGPLGLMLLGLGLIAFTARRRKGVL